jgi:hypothetical protein
MTSSRHHHHQKSGWDRFGDFQAGVGRMEATIGVIVGTVMGSLMILFGIAAFITAFIPRSLDDGSGAACGGSTPCPLPDEQCQNNVCTGKKKRHYWLIAVGFGAALVGALMIWLPRVWNRYTKKSRTAAQVGGTLAELQGVHDIFSN